MKKSIYIISESIKVIERVMYHVNIRQLNIVKGNLHFLEDETLLKIDINRNVNKPSAICSYPVLAKYITPSVFNQINAMRQNIHLPNGTLTTVDDAQMIIGTFRKPYLTVEQERNAIFIEIPNNIEERYYKVYANLVRCHAAFISVPYLNNISESTIKLLRNDYSRKIKGYNALISNFSTSENKVSESLMVKA